jgi:hypothetical protein
MMKFNTTEVITVACAVFRINGNTVVKDNDKGIPTSKLMLMEHFAGKNVITVTDEDQAFASLCGQHLQHRLLMSQLSDREQSDFVSKVTALTQNETIASNNFGFAVWIPKVVQGIQAEDQQKLDLAHLSFRSQYQGKVGEKLSVNFHPIRVKFVHEYNCFRHFGHDGNGNLIGFLHKKQLSGKITGKIKAHQVSSFNNHGKVTYLNYVKEDKSGS